MRELPQLVLGVPPRPRLGLDAVEEARHLAVRGRQVVAVAQRRGRRARRLVPRPLDGPGEVLAALGQRLRPRGRPAQLALRPLRVRQGLRRPVVGPARRVPRARERLGGVALRLPQRLGLLAEAPRVARRAPLAFPQFRHRAVRRGGPRGRLLHRALELREALRELPVLAELLALDAPRVAQRLLLDARELARVRVVVRRRRGVGLGGRRRGLLAGREERVVRLQRVQVKQLGPVLGRGEALVRRLEALLPQAVGRGRSFLDAWREPLARRVRQRLQPFADGVLGGLVPLLLRRVDGVGLPGVHRGETGFVDCLLFGWLCGQYISTAEM